MASLDAFLPLMNKGIRKNYDIVGNTYHPIGKSLFHVENSTALYEQVQHYIGYQTLPQVRDFGGQITEASLGKSFSKQYIQVHRGLKDIIPKEVIMNDQYGMITRWCAARGGAMAEIYNTNDELLAAAFFQAGFATTTPAPGSFDGQPLFSLSHPLNPGSTQVQANRPATNLPLGFAALDGARAGLEQQLKANGLTIIENNIDRLVYNPNQERMAMHLAKSDWIPDTADRDLNTLKGRYKLVSWPYWRSSGSTNPNTYNSWFVLGETNYLDWFVREAVTFESEAILSIRSVMFASFQSQILGASNFIGVWGSPGP